MKKGWKVLRIFSLSGNFPIFSIRLRFSITKLLFHWNATSFLLFRLYSNGMLPVFFYSVKLEIFTTFFIGKLEGSWKVLIFSKIQNFEFSYSANKILKN